MCNRSVPFFTDMTPQFSFQTVPVTPDLFSDSLKVKLTCGILPAPAW
jgi:hypothetical protein